MGGSHLHSARPRIHNLTTDAILALGTAIGRLVAGSIACLSDPATGSDLDALADVEDAVLAINAQLGQG